MYRTIFLKEVQKLAEGLLYFGQTRNKPKWVGEVETQSCHKLIPVTATYNQQWPHNFQLLSEKQSFNPISNTQTFKTLIREMSPQNELWKSKELVSVRPPNFPKKKAKRFPKRCMRTGCDYPCMAQSRNAYPLAHPIKRLIDMSSNL